ncbi:MAG: hypothetical protein AAFR28_06345 [Pseudomonadota bacterium]
MTEFSDALNRLFRTSKGELRTDALAVMRRLETECCGNRSSFSENALTMARNEGRREVYLLLTNAIHAGGAVRVTEEVINE